MHFGSHRGRARRALRLVALAGGISVSSAAACDLCSLYNASEQREERLGPWAGTAVQYTHFGTLQENGQQVANPDHERLDSVVTQVLAGWTFTPRLRAQLTLPFIARDKDIMNSGSSGELNPNLDNWADLRVEEDSSGGDSGGQE